MLVIAKLGFCLLLGIAVLVWYLFRVKKEDRKNHIHLLFLTAGLMIVMLPQAFLPKGILLNITDYLGLIIASIGGVLYVFTKVRKAKAKMNKEKKH